MKNFISGAIAGATLTSIIVFFTIFEQDPKPQVSPQSVETDTVVRSDVSGENANQSEPMDPMLTGFWTNLLRNVKLNKPIEGGPGFFDDIADDVEIIKIHTVDPLYGITRNDIKQTCLHLFGNEDYPDWKNGFFVDIFLKPDARRKLADTLLARDGVRHSIRLLDMEINSFIADTKLAKALSENAEIYPPLDDTGYDEKNIDAALTAIEPDFSFTVQRNATLTGLAFAQTLNGKTPIAMCSTKMDINDLPGYALYQKLKPGWKQASLAD
ncbi:MAG: hypothetical protein JKY60_17525 [Kordiimonadaceae bacterium]|nr:hypothetical protein [Kordiimonadaceae bacterium]